MQGLACPGCWRAGLNDGQSKGCEGKLDAKRESNERRKVFPGPGRPGVAPEQARQEQVDGAGEHEHRGRATKKYD